MMTYLCIIQARLYSTRFPGKVMQMVNGRTILRRVWDAAKGSWADHTVVAWPERWPEVDERNVFHRFVSLAVQYNPKYIIRLTSDCPLIESSDINEAIQQFEVGRRRIPPIEYFNNRKDGYDVQIFTPQFMHLHADTEHVIKDVPNSGGMSVNTPADLERVRAYAK